MNAGSNYARAKHHAQANANWTGQPWVIVIYGGTCWIHRLSTYTDGKAPDDAEIIHPNAPSHRPTPAGERGEA